MLPSTLRWIVVLLNEWATMFVSLSSTNWHKRFCAILIPSSIYFISGIILIAFNYILSCLEIPLDCLSGHPEAYLSL